MKAAIRFRINQKIKFLYIKKQKLNEQLYRLHLNRANYRNNPLTNRPRLRTLPPAHLYENQRLQRQFDGLLMMGIVMPETCWAVSAQQGNKFYDRLLHLVGCFIRIRILTGSGVQKITVITFSSVISRQCSTTNFLHFEIRLWIRTLKRMVTWRHYLNRNITPRQTVE
jgi:hypothetical protein